MHWLARVSIASLSVLALTAGVGIYLHNRRVVWTNDAFLDGYQVTVSSDVEARIIALLVDEGDWVESGAQICQLDESIFLSRKREAEAKVALLEVEVALKHVHYEKLRDIFQIARQEFETEVLSFLDYDKKEKDFRMSEVELQAARKALEQGIAQVGVIEELLRHTKVYAPRAGSIAKRWVVGGDVAHVGQPLFSLTDTQHIWVTANLEETKVGRVRVGDLVKVHIDAYPEQTFWGKVFAVRAAAASQFALIPPDNATGNYTKVVQRVPIKIALDLPDTLSHLYPGMSVEIDIQVQ